MGRLLGRLGEMVLKVGAFLVPAVPHAPWWLGPLVYGVGHVLGVNLGPSGQ